jgi:hypothetical protein
MPTFTVPLRDAITYVPAIETVTLASYPIFDETYRPHLNQQIKDQYWNQEIGQETVELFNFALRRKLNQIMPIYNQQYRISQIKFDPLQTVNIQNLAGVTGTTDTTGNSANNSASDAKSRTVAQQMPQTMLSENGDYATSAQDNISNTTANGNVTETSNVKQDQSTNSTTTGYQGNPAMLLLQYRQSLVNVDMMILDELKELFMLVWSNGDEFTERNYGLDYYAYLPL